MSEKQWTLPPMQTPFHPSGSVRPRVSGVATQATFVRRAEDEQRFTFETEGFGAGVGRHPAIADPPRTPAIRGDSGAG